MFPPVEASVLAENPDFASLYTTLTTEVLNPDGTTRAEPEAKARNAVREVSLSLETHSFRLRRVYMPVPGG